MGKLRVADPAGTADLVTSKPAALRMRIKCLGHRTDGATSWASKLRIKCLGHWAKRETNCDYNYASSAWAAL